MKLREWNAHLHGLVVFRALLNDPVVAKLFDPTDRMEAGAPATARVRCRGRLLKPLCSSTPPTGAAT